MNVRKFGFTTSNFLWPQTCEKCGPEVQIHRLPFPPIFVASFLSHSKCYKRNSNSNSTYLCKLQSGAYVIAFVGAAFSGLLAVAHFFALNFAAVAICVAACLVCLSIVWAQKKRNPSLYLPYLVINVGHFNALFFGFI